MTETYLNISEYLYVMEAHSLFKILGDKRRLSILRALLRKKMCVGKINECIGTSQPNVSQHLKVLKNAGLVNLVRNGKECCYYAVKRSEVRKLLNCAEKVIE